MIPAPKGSQRFDFGAPAVRLDSLTAADSWLVESDHQLVATATQNHGQSVTAPRHQLQSPLRLSFLHLLRAERWVWCPKSGWTGFHGLVRRQQMNPINQLEFWYVHSFEPDFPSYHRSSEYLVIAGGFRKQTYLMVMYISGLSRNIHIVIFRFVSGRFEADIILVTHLHMKNSLILL